MSNQPAPTRPWFRLASIARPAPQAPAPTPESAPAPPRPAAVRPTFRPAVQAQPPPTAGGVSSVPTSPARASQPSSPSDKKPTTSSVPSSPVKTVQTTSPPKTTTASLPSSPAKTVTSTASLPSSPAKPAVTTTASLPTSPPKPVATIASVPTSPAKTAPTTTSVTSFPTQKPASPVTTNTTRAPSPKASTTTLRPTVPSPIQSPKTKPPTAPPPSPLTLPPPQLRARDAEHESRIPVEAEQKTVLVQKTVDKPKGWLFGGPENDVGDTRKPRIPLNGPKESSKDGETKDKGHGKKFSSDSEDAGTRVITLAGENKGAFMELIQSPHKNGFNGSPHRLQRRANAARTGSDGSDYQSYSSSSDEAGNGKRKGKSNTSKTMPMNAFMNSNVQGVNNSIVYNSSCSHHDPGVHLSLLRKPTAGGFHVKERTNGYNS